MYCNIFNVVRASTLPARRDLSLGQIAVSHNCFIAAASERLLICRRSRHVLIGTVLAKNRCVMSLMETMACATDRPVLRHYHMVATGTWP